MDYKYNYVSASLFLDHHKKGWVVDKLWGHGAGDTI